MTSEQDKLIPVPPLFTLREKEALFLYAERLLGLLVAEPVEPQGILSRIETHVTQLRDFLHGPGQGALPLLVQEIRSIADHDAQISAARHEFLREFLVQMDQRLAKLDHAAFRVAVMERLDVVSARVAAIVVRLDSLMAGTEKMDRRMSVLEDMAEANRSDSASRHAEILRRLPDHD